MTTSDIQRLTNLVTISIVLLTSDLCTGAPREIGVLSATRDRYSWTVIPSQTVDADSLFGRHDELGLTPRHHDSLRSVFTSVGLNVGGEITSPQQLFLVFQKIEAERAEVRFGSGDSAGSASEVLWVSDSTFEQLAGEFWPGDVVAINANVTINGEVGGNVLLIGGDLILREAATIRGGAVVIGGILRQKGDGKIYGTVFAPAGHRRPRLSVTRAWEFEGEGFQWGPSFSYDRVDGARLGGSFAYQRSAYSPRVLVSTGYGIASETWQYQFGLEQKLLKNTDLTVNGSVFRMTETDDGPWVGRHSNTVYALAAGSDYRDYYGVDGGELGAIYKYRERGLLEFSYRNAGYRWLDAECGLWHALRPEHRFRENFSTVPMDILEPWIDRFEERTSAILLSLSVEPQESEEHLKRFDAMLRLSGEIAGGGLGGEFDYDRWQLSVRGEWRSYDVHRLSARVWYGKGRRELPPNKFFFLGGLGSLPGYSQKEFVGSEAMLINFEYRFDYWPNQMFDGGILLFLDVGRATFEDDFFSPSDFKTDIGVGLALGESIRLNVAKGLDSTDRDIRLSLSLWQKL